MSDIRLDRLHNHYVLIAPERMHRPDHHSTKGMKVSPEDCPFCRGNEGLTPPEVFAIRSDGANQPGWKTRVVPNLYKAVQIELQDHSRREGMFESIPGVGAHEVLIDSPGHDDHFAVMSEQQIADWLRSIARRNEDLRHDRRLIYLSVFKNHGAHAGATQPHPHTQLIAIPVMPRNELVFLESNLAYYRRHGRGKVEDLVENERLDGSRIVEEIGDFTAYCPYASSYPFEVMIVPRRALLSLDACNRDDIADLARLLGTVFSKMQKQLGAFDYNLTFRLAPLNMNFENEQYFDILHRFYRFSIRIMPRIYRLGGFELSTGMAINPVPPEECARLLNEERV